MSEQKAYFANLITHQDIPHTIIEDSLHQATQIVQTAISHGHLVISDKSTEVKSVQMRKGGSSHQYLEGINREIIKNEELYQQTKREMLLEKKMQSQRSRQQREAKQRDVEDRVKKWTEDQQQLQVKHQALLNLRKLKQDEFQSRLKIQQEQRLEFQRIQKQKSIQQRLKDKQQSRVQREQMVRHSSLESKQLQQPKYLEMQRRFRQLESELTFQEQIMKRNNKLQMKYSHEAIKEHQKQVLRRLQARAKNDKPHQQKQLIQPFNPFFLKDQLKRKQAAEKLRRQKKYVEKVKKQIPVLIDEAKKVKVEIALDRGKNPHKYNFLAQKALSEFQIFGQFQEFQLAADPKQLGKQYLRQLPSINENSRVQKSRSTTTILEIDKAYKSKYTDYLQELKSHRATRSTHTEESIKTVFKTPQQKDKACSNLSEKARQYDAELKRKLEHQHQSDGLRSSIMRKKECDQMYLKSIKTKLACLQMNN